MNKSIGASILTITIAIMLSGCGGGGGGSGGGGGGTLPGIDRLGVKAGTVTGFGSIFVNGVEFETDTAEFEVDDDGIGSGQADLTADDYVEVRGGADPASPGNILAGLLERDDLPGQPGEDTELRGFVEQVMPPSFTIAGVTIETNDDTVFRDLNEILFSSADDFFNALQEGDLVDVDGMEIAQTTIIAKEVQLED